MFEQGVRPSERDEGETISSRRETLSTLEILPKIVHCLLELVICCADCEHPFDLLGQFPVDT